MDLVNTHNDARRLTKTDRRIPLGPAPLNNSQNWSEANLTGVANLINAINQTNVSNFFNFPTLSPIARLNQRPEITPNLKKHGRAQNLHLLI